MGRWPDDARERLERAAVALFLEQGFASTTVRQIAEHAGLTTRTYFRHFADKREVLFAGDEIPQYARALLRSAPDDLKLDDLVVRGLRAAAIERFDGRLDDFRRRARIIETDLSLGERDAQKWAALTEAVADGLTERGLDARVASLLAGIAVTVLHVAFDEWLTQPGSESMAAFVDEALAGLRHIVPAFADPQKAGGTPG